MVSALVTLFFASPIPVVSASECPAGQAVAAELERLGALAVLAQVGTAEIAVDRARLRVEIRDQRGIVLGGREVSAPSDCAARASLAAVLIAAWTGEWMATNLGEPTGSAKPAAGGPVEPRSAPARPRAFARVPSESVPVSAVPPAAPPVAAMVAPPAVASPAVAAPAAPPLAAPAAVPPAAPPLAAPAAAPPGPIVRVTATAAAVQRPLRVEVGLVGFGAHDGDAGALGVGGQALLLGERLGLIALVEATGQRQRALGPGQAGYHSLRFGLGASARRTWTHLFGEIALLPELGRLVVQGDDLVQPNSVTRWGIVADGRARLGWKAGRLAPFAYLGASWSFLREHLTLDDRPQDAVTLSRLNLAAGLGISFFVR